MSSKQYRVVTIHPLWVNKLVTYMNKNNNNLSIMTQINANDMHGELMTLHEAIDLYHTSVHYYGLPNDNHSPIRIIGGDLIKWFSVTVEFADNEQGREAAHMEEIGIFDLEKHFLAVPRMRTGRTKNTIADNACWTEELITFDFVAREEIYYRPKWLDLHEPVEFTAGDINDDSFVVKKIPSFAVYTVEIPIHPRFVDVVKNYDFDNNEFFTEMVRTGRLGMELKPDLTYLDETIENAWRFCTIDPKCIVANVLHLNKKSMTVTCKTRVSAPADKPWGKPLDKYKAVPRVVMRGDKVVKFITFDIVEDPIL